jgi:hypothetical protein
MISHTINDSVRTIFNENGLRLRLLDIEVIPNNGNMDNYYTFIANGTTESGTQYHITFGFHDYELEDEKQPSAWRGRISDYINCWDCPFSEGAESDPELSTIDRAEVARVYRSIYSSLVRIAA